MINQEQEEAKLLAVKINTVVVTKLEDHIDKSRMSLRKKGIKFSKKQMYEFLFETGIVNFKEAAFTEWLQKVIK